MDSNRTVYLGVPISMILSSIGVVLSGHLWLLFGTVPVGLTGLWLFVRSGHRSGSGAG